MRAVDGLTLSNGSGTTAGKVLQGGTYHFHVASATFNAASVKVQFLGFDGTTWLDFTGVTLAAAGMVAAVDAPEGQYRIVCGAATAVFAAFTRVPKE